MSYDKMTDNEISERLESIYNEIEALDHEKRQLENEAFYRKEPQYRIDQ